MVPPLSGTTAPRRRGPSARRARDHARRALTAWLESDAKLGSRLSPYYHFGALSPLEAVVRAQHKPDWIRELAWRDFYFQLLRAEPERFDLGTPPEAQADARFDAGMRQLREEGWMPNRINWLWVVANTRRLFNPELQAKKLAGYVAQWSR